MSLRNSKIRTVFCSCFLVGAIFLTGFASVDAEIMRDASDAVAIIGSMGAINHGSNELIRIGQAGEKAYQESLPYDFSVAFAGDINLDEKWSTTLHLDCSENGIYDCISPELIEMMQNSDLMCLNNEFTFSTKGSPMRGKAFTFRANPERVNILQTLGVDVVKLANNHIFDYGKEAFFETIKTLDDAGIAHMDAGADAVIGAHSHCLQGMEYYNGKPILYSLGNFWFNDKTLDTILVQLHFYGENSKDGHLDVEIIPAVQSGCETHIANDYFEKRRILDFLESISVNVAFTDEGFMYKKE